MTIKQLTVQKHFEILTSFHISYGIFLISIKITQILLILKEKLSLVTFYEEKYK